MPESNPSGHEKEFSDNQGGIVMSRFSNTVFIVFAVIGVLAFLGPFDATRAFGEPGIPVKVVNTPLPVTDVAYKRDDFTVTIPLDSMTGIGGAVIGLPSAAIVETVAASCQSDRVTGYLTIQTKTQTPQGLTAASPQGVPDPPKLNSVLLGYWALLPFPIDIDISGLSAAYMPPTAVAYPVGTQFTLYVTVPPVNPPVSGANCSVSIVLRYIQ
jgi:hypothetical protein